MAAAQGTYVQVAAGRDQTMLFQSKGKVTAVGYNKYGQCEIPEAQGDATYIQVAAGK